MTSDDSGVNEGGAERSGKPRDRRRGVLRGFRHARDGAAAIEFAIVAVPFVIILFAIIETCVIFFAGQILDSATASAAREIRTGKAKQDGWTAARFKQEVCTGLSGLFDCENRLHVDVKVFSDFSSAVMSPPLDADGEVDDGSFGYSSGDKSQIVVARTFYEWPVFFDFFSLSMADTAGGDRLLASVVTFRNEPFPW
jgi:Flp pilus assembly protein TadG